MRNILFKWVSILSSSLILKLVNAIEKIREVEPTLSFEERLGGVEALLDLLIPPTETGEDNPDPYGAYESFYVSTGMQLEHEFPVVFPSPQKDPSKSVITLPSTAPPLIPVVIRPMTKEYRSASIKFTDMRPMMAGNKIGLCGKNDNNIPVRPGERLPVKPDRPPDRDKKEREPLYSIRCNECGFAVKITWRMLSWVRPYCPWGHGALKTAEERGENRGIVGGTWAPEGEETAFKVRRVNKVS